MSNQTQLTQILDDAAGGDDGAFSRLIEAVYSDLHRIASHRFAMRHTLDTLQPTELVHETVLRLIEQRERWKNRDHFFAIATRLMLRVVIDRQRRRLALKRGGGARAVPVEHAGDEVAELRRLAKSPESGELEPVRVGLALAELYEQRPRAAEVVTLHIAAQLPLPRIAELLSVSLATVERDWSAAKSHLLEAIGPAKQ